MKLIKGGYSQVFFDSDPAFSDPQYIAGLLKAGTFITPSTMTDEFADEKPGAAAKKFAIGIRSADRDAAVLAALQAAEEARTPLQFAFCGLHPSILIHDCETAWDEYVDPNVNSDADLSIKKVGEASAHFESPGELSAGSIIATEAIPAIDLTRCKILSFWFWSDPPLGAGDIQLLLDNTANCASPLKALDLPAISGATWTKVNLSLGDASALSAVISVGLKTIAGFDGQNLRIDDVRALAPHIVVKNVIPRVEEELNEVGKFNALRIAGEAVGATESDCIEENY